jgi:hypothetical protein
LIVMLLALAAFPIAPTQRAAAQDDDRDLREATFTAQEILRLAYERKFNAMYDRIHPDAHEVVPRAAAIGVFKAAYAETNAGEATVTGSKLVAWTWPVTGKTYDRAVEISFEQPYTDDDGNQQLLQDRMYLVKAEGEWRWFFGSSKEFVETAIETYGGPQGEPLVEGDLVTNVANDLDAFYRDVLSYTDFDYESPGFVYVEEGQSVQTACGRAEEGFWGFFCPPDVTIYVDASLIAQLDDEFEFAAAFVIAHEWAHHVQTLVTFDRVTSDPNDWNELWSIELELMADCMAGAWALDVDTRGLLETDDIDEAVEFTVQYLGDPAYIDEYDQQAHGSADQRVQSFLNGYENGFSDCNIVI